MKKLMLIISIFCCMFIFGACNNVNKTNLDNNSRKERIKYTDTFFNYFDTISTIIAYTESEREFEDLKKLVKDELEKYHKYYDIYNEYEEVVNLKTINEKAKEKEIKVSKEIIDLLLFSKKLYQLSNKKVNIAFGSVLKIWHDKREEAKTNKIISLPSKEELKEANKSTDIDKIIIDEENSTVFIEDDNLSLDVGAIAKGYATEQVAKKIKEKGYKNVLLSVGGNVRAIGNKLNENFEEIPWSVGIQNPNKEEQKNVEVLNIEDKSLVTSGVYERFFEYEGKNYHHIINPKSLFPEEEFLSISIVTKDSGYADALSTAVFNMDLEEGKKFIENLEDVEAMWILKSEERIYSSKFEELLK